MKKGPNSRYSQLGPAVLAADLKRSAKMKNLLLFFLCIPLMALGAGFDPQKNLKRDATACADAWNRGAYETFVDCLSDRVVANADQRKATLEGIKQAFGYMENLGLKTLSVGVETPKEFRVAGDLLTSIFPITAVLEGPDAKMTAQEFVLGVSRDRGANWKFVILFKVSQFQLDQKFPELEGKLEIPLSRPVVLKAKGSPWPRYPGP